MDIFGGFLFQFLKNDSAERAQYARDVLFSHSTVEKEFFIRAIEICNKQRIFIKSCRYWLSNRQSTGGKLFSDPFSSKGICYRALVPFTYSRCMPIRGNDVIASGMLHQQKIKKFVEELSCRYQSVLITGIKIYFVLIINPTFWKSKYAFLFPFSIKATDIHAHVRMIIFGIVSTRTSVFKLLLIQHARFSFHYVALNICT